MMTPSAMKHPSALMPILCLVGITLSLSVVVASSTPLAFISSPTSIFPSSPTSFFRQHFLPSTSLPSSSLSAVSANNINNGITDITNDENENDGNNIFMTTDTILTTKSSILDKNLTTDERSTVNVVRRYGPSVAYVTSYSIIGGGTDESGGTETKSQKDKKTKESIPPPRSTALGSGSAFAISSSDGYFATNYHVIERAYQIQQSQKQMDSFIQNITQSLFPNSSGNNNNNNDNSNNNQQKQRRTRSSRSRNRNRRNAQVYLRLASSSTSSSSKTPSSLVPARIVSVKPELDSAILHINMTESLSSSITLPQPIPYGSSSRLLVGQSVLAIGNPFGLDQSITSGVVSALDRSVKGIAGNNINNCIQTDAAINPGNSGGPLLNSNGECIGMNTMIITTSGSNAGIGFAISMDDIRDYVEKEIDDDRNEQLSLAAMYDSGTRKVRGRLGVEIVTDALLQSQLEKRVQKRKSEGDESADNNAVDGVFIVKVERGSPAYDAQIKPLSVDKRSSRITYAGDRIIAVNSNIVKSSKELYDDLKTRVVGENISITVEDALGARRVVYVELDEKKD